MSERSEANVRCNNLLGDEALALARWLAHAYQELDECRYAAIALSAEQCKDHMIMRCPVIQGTGNQMALARFASGTVDKDALARAFAKLKASPNAQAQPPSARREAAG